MHPFIFNQLEAIAAEWDSRPDARPKAMGRIRNVGGLFTGGDRTTRNTTDSHTASSDHPIRPHLHRR